MLGKTFSDMIIDLDNSVENSIKDFLLNRRILYIIKLKTRNRVLSSRRKALTKRFEDCNSVYIRGERIMMLSSEVVENYAKELNKLSEEIGRNSQIIIKLRGEM